MDLTPANISTQISKGSFKPNIYLTNMSMAYFQDIEDYVSKSLFPILPVRLSTASYYKFSKALLARDNVQRKPNFGKVHPAVMGLTDDSYHCYVDQVIVGIDRIQTLDYGRSKAPGVADPREAKTKFIAEQMNIHLDILFAQGFFNENAWSNVFTGDNTISINYDTANNEFLPFDDVNSDPIIFIDYLKAEIRRVGRRQPNKLALGIETFNALKNNSKILERVKYGGSSANPATVNQKSLAELFGLEEVKVFASTYNKANLGQDEDMDFICEPKGALLCYTTNTPAIDEATAGYIFSWDMLGDGNYLPILQYEGEGGTHTEFMEGLMATDMKKTGEDLAVYLKDCVSV